MKKKLSKTRYLPVNISLLTTYYVLCVINHRKKKMLCVINCTVYKTDSA